MFCLSQTSSEEFRVCEKNVYITRQIVYGIIYELLLCIY